MKQAYIIAGIKKKLIRVWWWCGYNLGIYELNWGVKRILGDRNMHDKEMWRRLTPPLLILAGIIIVALTVLSYRRFMQ